MVVGGGMSENGVMFGSFCLSNDLVIGGTLFLHHNLHKMALVSPCGKYKKQIDHITVSKRHRSALLDVRDNRGADIGSDHKLSFAKIRLKLKSQKGKPVVDRYDIDMLRREGEEKDEFRIQSRNRFLVLETLEDGGRSVGEMSGDVNEALYEAAGCMIRRRHRLRKKMWMSEETWWYDQKER
ncbi:uncharacterized protein [Macrobrachium rosenbergii]|uniref:uncharacterized protein n=1 Tax=Macrobrachium rosenbergii TaxID=79674 RepID=UPI0034D76D4C